MNQIRPAAVAGAFYPGNEQVLSRELDALLAQAQPQASLGALPKALIVPHAGYIYSGPIAASAYRLLAAGRDTITRVVLLGPAHRVAVRGLALPQASAFATPLGLVRIDQDACSALRNLPQVVRSDAAHALEHSLEVQLPFLQKVLGDFALVPLVVGDASTEEVAQVLDRLWGGAETLIVISSDLSHYLPYAQAQSIDHKTSDMILHLQTGITHEQACGGTPVNGLLLVAKAHGIKPELLDLRNSGDTAGGPEQVVGYAAFAFVAETRHVH
jgi:AmmeMemoRadiSam system protein B